MRNFCQLSIKSILIFPLIFFCSTSLLFAQQKIKGEIININYDFQIAFTDMGTESLSVGDIVEVRVKSGDIVSMQVIETTEILSKLVPHSSREGKDVERLFGQVIVGDHVVIAGKGPKPKMTQVSGRMIDGQNLTALNAEQDDSASAPADVDINSQQALASYEKFELELKNLKSRFQEVEGQKQELNQHIEYLNEQLMERSSQIEQLQKENKLITKDLSDSLMQIEELSREKKDRVQKIERLERAIRQLNDKLIRMSQLLDIQ